VVEINHLDAGVVKELLSDRIDLSVPILGNHDDKRTAV
jgi:hypothetical protein